MKRPGIIWVVLLLAVVAVYFLPATQATLQTTTRIRIEQNGSDVNSSIGAESCSGFDPFFVQANYFRLFPNPGAKAPVATR